jgi:hypothetical protein
MNPTLCTFSDCGQVARARITGNVTVSAGMVGVLVRPVNDGGGDLACLDHAHHAIDVMLANDLDTKIGPPACDDDEPVPGTDT